MELFQKRSLQRRNLRAGLQNLSNFYDFENYDIYIAHILTRMRSWAFSWRDNYILQFAPPFPVEMAFFLDAFGPQ